jgi:NAD(P)-dependent dehydrogenase (short-subunit alcohol dehydrogenase family)
MRRVAMRRPLAGKVCLVAGATRAAGRGIAIQLGAEGTQMAASRWSSLGGKSA